VHRTGGRGRFKGHQVIRFGGTFIVGVVCNDIWRAFSVWMEFAVVPIRGSGHPRGMVTMCLRRSDVIASGTNKRQWTLGRNVIGHTAGQRFKQSKGVGTNDILECNARRKTRSAQQPQPDDVNPNTAESMVKTCTVPSSDGALQASSEAVPAGLPSVFGRNLQCQQVRGVDFREECHWAHACSLQANMRGIQWHPRV
jgi:hypothetical protein